MPKEQKKKKNSETDESTLMFDYENNYRFAEET